MSLVEQAIAKLRQQQAVAQPHRLGPHGRGQTPSPQVELQEDPVSLANRLPVNTESLRVAGYLPEQEKDRQFADHYRRIKRPLIEKALSPSTGVWDPRVIMVASAVPGDGKTFTSINLALSMALERDVSVLLIDSDVAKQHITQIFGLRDRAGLLDALVDESIEPESLVVPTNVRGLSILPAGRPTEGTAELMSSARMRSIVSSLCARAPRRILLLDSPPLLITEEGRAIAKLAGQIVLVVRAGGTPRHAVKAAVDLFDPQQAGGLVLNQVKVGLTEGYYGYGAYGTYGVKDNES